MSARTLTYGLVAGIAALAAPLRAQEHPIQFTVRAPRNTSSLRPGDTLTLGVSSAIPVGWHLYSLTQPPGGPIATTIDVGPRALVSLRGVIGSTLPTMAPDPNFGIESEWYEDSAAFRLPLRIAASAAPGKATIEV